MKLNRKVILIKKILKLKFFKDINRIIEWRYKYKIIYFRGVYMQIVLSKPFWRFESMTCYKAPNRFSGPFNVCVLEREVRAEGAPMEMAQVKGGNGHHSRPRVTRAVSWLPSRSVSEWRGCALNRLRSKHVPLPFRSSRLGVPRPASFRHIHILFNSSIAVDALLFPLFLFILPRRGIWTRTNPKWCGSLTPISSSSVLYFWLTFLDLRLHIMLCLCPLFIGTSVIVK